MSDAETLDALVRHIALMAINRRGLRRALDQIPVWRQAEAAMLGMVHHDGRGADAQLRELVAGLEVAAGSHPALLRVLTSAARHPQSTWSAARRAVGQPEVPEEIGSVRAQRRADRERWARASAASPPPLSSLPAARGSRRRP